MRRSKRYVWDKELHKWVYVGEAHIRPNYGIKNPVKLRTVEGEPVVGDDRQYHEVCRRLAGEEGTYPEEV